jgi:hypothetical protein
MNMPLKLFLRRTILLLTMTLSVAHAQDSAIFDSQKNSWNLQYQDPETSQWVRKTYVQQNAILPSLRSTIQSQQNQLLYRFRISNRADSKQLVDTFRIWGITSMYKIPDLPLVTASAKLNPELEDKQQWDQLNAKRRFEKSVVFAPKGWSAGLRVDEQAGQTSFVWSPGLKDSDPDGIPPGKAQDGFMVLRSELPGVARAKLTGSTDEPWGLDNLPDTPFWKQKIAEIQDRDYVLVPVLAPVIPIPTPYSAVELTRRLQVHVQTWLKYGHVQADVLARLNRQFDVLIPALETHNKRAVRAAVEALRKECSDHHADLRDEFVKVGEDNQDALPMLRNASQRAPTSTVGIDRVAARALIFNLQYVSARLD